MAPQHTFTGFSRDSFQFFRDLADPRNNNKIWFDANRFRYDDNVVGKLKELLEALKPCVLKLNPNFEVSGKTNGNFSRINRDIRFSKDKSPYKLNYYLYFFDKRRARDGDGRLYVGMSGEGLTVGFSIYGEWRRKSGDVLKDVLKRHLARESELLETFLQRRAIARRYESYWYSMVDKEWAQHSGLPRNEDHWTSLLGWVVRRRVKPREAASSRVLAEIQAIFKDLFPLYLFSAAAERQWVKRFKEVSR